MPNTQRHTLANPRHVSILGAGAWGTTLALLANEAGHQVMLVAHTANTAEYMIRTRRHPSSLVGVAIPSEIRIEHTENHHLGDAEFIVVAVPTQKLRSSVSALAPVIRNKRILSVVKGLELGTQLRPSQVLESELGRQSDIAVLSGPNLSTEIAGGLPAATVIAAPDLARAEPFVDLFHSTRFRVYTSDDVIGVELGGALKNIIAIGAGIADGMAAGDNAKAAFLTRGMAEIARLGVACGAQPLTFAGLSGIGDLIATCSSSLSRNHRVGAALAAGQSLDHIVSSMREVAEGVPTTRAARELARQHGLALPIIEQMNGILFEGVSPSHAIGVLMERDPTHEMG